MAEGLAEAKTPRSSAGKSGAASGVGAGSAAARVSCAMGSTAGQRLRSGRVQSARGASALAGGAQTATGWCDRAAATTGSLSARGATLVAPPWGAERANIDRPSWSQCLQQQRGYHQQLDEQVALNSELRRRRREEIKALEQRSAATLATSSHVWGTQAFDKSGERQLFQELVTQIEQRRQSVRDKKKAETDGHSRRLAETERQISVYVERKKHQRIQEQQELQAALREAMDDKRSRREKERAEELRTERDHIHHLVIGQQQPRRMRLPGCPPGVRKQ